MSYVSIAGARIDVLDLSAKILLKKDAILIFLFALCEAYVKAYLGLIPCNLSG